MSAVAPGSVDTTDTLGQSLTPRAVDTPGTVGALLTPRTPGACGETGGGWKATIENQTAPAHSPLTAAATSTAPAPRRPASSTTRRRLPPSVARVLLDTSGPTARRFGSASPTRLALAVLTPCARVGFPARRLAALLDSVGAWPSPSAQRLSRHLAGLDEDARAEWVDAMVHRAERLARGGDEAAVERLAAAWVRGALAPWPGPAGGVDRAIWLALVGAAWAAGTPQVRMGSSELVELTGVPLRSVWRALRRLEQGGRVVITDRSVGGLRPNRYRVVGPPVPSGRPAHRHRHLLPPRSMSPTGTGAVVCHAPAVVVEAPDAGPAGPDAPSVRPDDPLLGAAGGLHPGWHPGALGLGAHALACHLLTAVDEPMSVRRLAEGHGRGREATLRAVRTAVATGLAERVTKGVVAGPALIDAGALEALLERTADESGTRATAEAHRAARLARAAERRRWRPGAEGSEGGRQGGEAVGSSGSNGVGGGTGPAGVWGDGGSLPRRGGADRVTTLTPQREGR